MIRNKKTIIIITLVAIPAFIAAYVLFNCNSYKSIQKYVIKNQDELRGYAAKMMAGEDVKLPLKIVSAQVYEGINTIVEFSVPAVTRQYCGFYYSENDVPAAFQNTDFLLYETGNNSWEWKADGDNHGKTIKITDCWYYFEASF